MKSTNLLNELKKLDSKALNAKILTMRAAISDAKYEVVTGNEKNTSKVKSMKRDLARALTVQNTDKREAKNEEKPPVSSVKGEEK